MRNLGKEEGLLLLPMSMYNSGPQYNVLQRCSLQIICLEESHKLSLSLVPIWEMYLSSSFWERRGQPTLGLSDFDPCLPLLQSHQSTGLQC